MAALIPMDSPNLVRTSPATSAFLVRVLVWQSRVTFLLAVMTVVCAIALTIRTYMPCPFWDEWAEINAVAQGAGLSSFAWLWSEHNEHRLLITRLLLLLDLRVFSGKNVSLFVEIYLFQMAAWMAVCLVVERLTSFPRFLKTTLQGLFGFCFFHLNQAENLTWAFQVSFVLPFSIATLVLLATAFFGRIRRPRLLVVGIGLAPFAAALNLSGGFLLGPVAIGLALVRGIPARHVLAISLLFAASAAAYLAGYQVSDLHHRPLQALAHPKEIFIYVLTYIGASWTKLLPHKERLLAFLSFLVFAALTANAANTRYRTSPFEWFCIAGCTLALTVATLTAVGRQQFGAGQAYAGRYQTPAMLYWACLGALLLITVYERWPSKIVYVETLFLVVMILSAATFIPIWRSVVSRGDLLSRACQVVMRSNNDEQAAKLLYGSRQDVAPGVAYLHGLWNR